MIPMPRPLPAAKILRLAIAALVVVLLGAMLAACSGDEPGQDQPTEAAAESMPAPVTRTPVAIGQDIQAVHAQTMDQLARILESNASPEQLLDQITELRESAIRRLVALGRERQKLDTFGKADCDRVIQQGLTQIPAYQTLDQARQQYDSSPELAETLDSFNDIIHYAILELLKEQYPTEAARLGVD